jgi:hypothetical protein
MNLINEYHISTVVHMPQGFTRQAAEKWLDSMSAQYDIGYQRIPSFHEFLGGEASHDDLDYQIVGDDNVVRSIERALHHFADEAASPDRIVGKVYELTMSGGLPVRDSIGHCAGKFGKSAEEIEQMIRASKQPEVRTLVGMLDGDIKHY